LIYQSVTRLGRWLGSVKSFSAGLVEEPVRGSFFLKELRNYGSLFLGPWSTVAYSDKGIAGTNHVLPTGKTARYNAGLSVSRFLKPLTYQRAQQNATSALAPAVQRISAFEGLAAHEATATLRIDKVGRHPGAFDGTPGITRGQR
jgi:sulfopropanediol 3-dehydrogenase